MMGSYIDAGIRMSQKDLDVTDQISAMYVCKKYMPSVIIHLASLTDLAVCEQDPAKAYLVNAVGAYNMAVTARSVGAKLVYISTSGIFDGTKTEPYTDKDIPNPINVYGHSKYLGELAVRGILEDYIIVRTSWLFGGGVAKDKKFVGKILVQLGGQDVCAVYDKVGSPTYAKDLVAAIMELIEKDKCGIFNVCNGVATRYDFAKEIARITGSSAKILPVASTEFKSGYESGNNEGIISSVPMRSWEEALREYINNECGGSIYK